MTRRELIRALLHDAGCLGCVMTGSDSYGDADGLRGAVKWAEARQLNRPDDHALAAWRRRAQAAQILYKIV